MLYFALILIGILSRFLPHPANFTIIGALALFSGYYLKNKKLALILPLISLILSDWIIGFYQWQLMVSVYLSFALVVLLGFFIRNKKWFFALPASLLGTTVFFLVTNWAVWQFTPWYPHNFPGLMSCYIAGLPFVKNSFAGDLIYTLGFFSLTQTAIFLVNRKEFKFKHLFLSSGRF